MLIQHKKNGLQIRYANRQGNETVEELNEEDDPQSIKFKKELDKIEKGEPVIRTLTLS